MNSKKLLFYLLIISLSGCNKPIDYDDRYPYYKFNDTDYELIISYDYQIGQIITYENQYGEQIHFKVVENKTEKRGYYAPGTFSGGGGYLVNYYDRKIIRFRYMNLELNEDYEFCRFQFIFSKNNDTFHNGLSFPLWNGSGGFLMDGDDAIDIIMTAYNNDEKIQMNVNGYEFHKVVILDSGEDEVHNNCNCNCELISNINKIYYDYDFGIIQFNDIDGNEWKVIYPD